MRAAAILAALALAGCAADPPRPEVVSRIESLPPVRIPVPVRCIGLGELPRIPATAMSAAPGLAPEQRLDQLDADLLALREYAIRADVALRTCATEVNPGVKP